MVDFLTLKYVADNINNNDRIVVSDNAGINIDGISTNIVGKTDHKHNAFLAFFSAAKTQHNQRITEENIATADHIRTALQDRFGGHGLLIFNKHVQSGKDITKAVLQNILTDAQNLEQTKVASGIRFALNALDNDSPRRLFVTEGAVLQKYHFAPGRVSDLIIRAKLEMNDVKMSVEELVQQNARLRLLQADMDNFDRVLQSRPSNITFNDGVVVDQMRNDLAIVKTALANKIASNQSQIASNPLLFANVKGAFAREYAAAGQIAQDYKNMLSQSNRPVPREIDSFIAYCQQKGQNPLSRIENNQERPLADNDIVTTDELKSLATIEKSLVSQLKALAKSVRPPLENDNAVKTRFKDTVIELLNTQAWPIITKQIAINAYGRSNQLTSVMTPANQFAPLKQRMGNLNGISSNDQSSAHANNLWVSELRSVNLNAPVNNNVLFTGIRHGINCAFGISDANARAEANKQRVKDLYTVALLKKPDLLRQVLDGSLPQPVDLTIVSNSLVTPSLKEKNLLLEQNAAWLAACDSRDANGNPLCTLTVQDQQGNNVQVQIRPKVVKFNFGVNAFAQKSVISSALGGWGTSDPMIREGLDQLIGQPQGDNSMPHPTSLVGRYLASLPPFSPQSSKIRVLVSQIRNLYASGAYRDSSRDPYALPARVALLADMCGFTSCYNCKSGKDRTGQMDAEIKALAVQLLQSSALENPTPGVNEHNREVLREMMMNAGNHEIQALNTGLGGYNVPVSGLNSLKGLTDIFNNDQELSTFKGGMAYVPS